MIKRFRNQSIFFQMISSMSVLLLILFSIFGLFLFKISESSANASSIRLYGILIMAFAFFLILFGIWNAARLVVNETKELTSYAQDIAKGHTDFKIAIHSNDELGILAQTFQTMQNTITHMVSDIEISKNRILDGNLQDCTDISCYNGDFKKIMSGMNELEDSISEIIRSVKNATDSVTDASNKISGSSQNLAQGSTEQASAIEQLSASLTEIAGKIKANASDALAANRLSSRASNEVERGNEHMQKMMNAMSQISDSSGQIGKIIKVIEDIAFQTNILALNAAVEAARAGAAGKGFAVVADEVRNLASKSAQAVKNTTEYIQNSMAMVENGTRIAKETQKSLEIILKTTKRANELIGSISSATSDQDISISQITQGINQISAVVQTNTATAEESAATGEELNTQTQNLEDLISGFKLSDSADKIAKDVA